MERCLILHTQILQALQRVIHELQGKKYEPHELHFALGIPGEITLAQLGIKNVVKANLLWNDYMKEAAHTMRDIRRHS